MYALARLPMRKAIKPGSNAAIAPSWTAAELASLEGVRETTLAFMDNLREAFEKGHHRTVVGNTAAREEVAAAMTGHVEGYVRQLCQLVAAHPLYGQYRYYFWGAAITERLNHAFADFRYDMMNIYTNVAMVFHEMAKYILEVPQGSPMTEAMEKEAYAHLGFAAGYLSVAHGLAQEMAAKPLAKVDHDMIEEMKPHFIECLKNMCLEEAQWIGMEKAVRNELNKNKEIVPKLTHQALVLAGTALGCVTKFLNSSTTAFKVLVMRLHVRHAVLEALVHAQTAPCRYDASPSEALWFAKKAEEYVGEVHAARRKMQEGSAGDSDVKRFLEWTILRGKAVENAVDRVRQINSLVNRAKMGEGPYSLPPAQELARCKPVTLPCAVPAGVVPSPPPPPGAGEPPPPPAPAV